MFKESVIFHIAQLSDFQNRNETAEYRCASLSKEGFIHCCDREQLPGVLQRYYEGVDGLVLLRLDIAKLKPTLVRENTVGGTELFPHLYGPINPDAIIEALPFGLQSPKRLELIASS